MLGLPRDQAKANELWLKAGELGCDVAYHNLGNAYNFGSAVTIDKKKAKQYYELQRTNMYKLYVRIKSGKMR